MDCDSFDYYLHKPLSLGSSGVEQWTENPCVSGSNPLLDTNTYLSFL